MSEFDKNTLGRMTKRDKEISISFRRIRIACEGVPLSNLIDIQNSLIVLASDSSNKLKEVVKVMESVIINRTNEKSQRH